MGVGPDGYREHVTGKVGAGTRRADLFDALVALGFAALSLTILAGTIGASGPMGLGVVLALLHVLPLAVRRRWPEPVLETMVVTGVVFVVAGYPPVALGPAIVVAVYTVAARCPRRRAAVLLCTSTAVMAAAVALTGSGPDTVVSNVLVFGVAWLVGDGNRRAIESAAAERERAAELARTREQLAHQAVTDERLRIARELHDVVAHSMSVIAVQAGTGRVVLERSPELAREALVVIESTSRNALDEMRRLLNVLRDDRDEPLLTPNPGLGDLDALVADTVASGLPVHVRVDGERVVLPAGADLAAFRIVQEALTNVRRHASATHVSVAVRYEPVEVVIEVVDDGRGGPGDARRSRARRHAGTGRAVRRPGRGRASARGRVRAPGRYPLRKREPVTIRVAVADDQALVRTGFSAMVAHADDLELVGEAGNGEDAVALARAERPDVMLDGRPDAAARRRWRRPGASPATRSASRCGSSS